MLGAAGVGRVPQGSVLTLGPRGHGGAGARLPCIVALHLPALECGMSEQWAQEGTEGRGCSAQWGGGCQSGVIS